MEIQSFEIEGDKRDLENGIEISYDETVASITYRNLKLSKDNLSTPEVEITVEKRPIHIIEGASYDNSAVFVDSETPKMRDLAVQAEGLKSLEEVQRTRAVLELLRQNVAYAYKNVVDVVAQTNPQLADWVIANVGSDSQGKANIPLSEIFDKGFGICRHLAVAYLYLAQKAGLEGTIITSDYGGITNIQRADTQEPLFKSVKVGEPVVAHDWVEIKTSDGKWIPVDPSVKLVGDTEEGMKMFKKAGYKGVAGMGIEVGIEPDALSPQGTWEDFKPGEPKAIGKYSLLLGSTRPTIRGLESIPPTNEPYSGDGSLQIAASRKLGVLNLSILSVGRL